MSTIFRTLIYSYIFKYNPLNIIVIIKYCLPFSKNHINIIKTVYRISEKRQYNIKKTYSSKKVKKNNHRMNKDKQIVYY